MHVDGSWHALGAAAAAARLAGLDAAGAARAVRLVACQIPFSLYAPIAAGLDGRNSYPAHAVLLGLAAAAAAAAGMDAPTEGFAEARRIALGADGPAPCAPAAALALRPALDGRQQRITAIRLETYAEALTYAGNRAPASAIKAQFSLSWAIAAALAQGDLGPAAYTEAALADPQLHRLEALVDLAEDPAMTAAARRAARVVVEVDGTRLSEAVDGVAGDPDRPMDDAAVRAKFLRLAGPDAASVAAALLRAPRDSRVAVLGQAAG
jgi:2-methylcitrate dehydratase PrpD